MGSGRGILARHLRERAIKAHIHFFSFLKIRAEHSIPHGVQDGWNARAQNPAYEYQFRKHEETDGTVEPGAPVLLLQRFEVLFVVIHFF